MQWEHGLALPGLIIVLGFRRASALTASMRVLRDSTQKYPKKMVNR